MATGSKKHVALTVRGDRNETRLTFPTELTERSLEGLADTVRGKDPRRTYYVVEMRGPRQTVKGATLYVWHVGEGFSHDQGWWVDAMEANGSLAPNGQDSVLSVGDTVRIYSPGFPEHGHRGTIQAMQERRSGTIRYTVNVEGLKLYFSIGHLRKEQQQNPPRKPRLSAIEQKALEIAQMMEDSEESMGRPAGTAIVPFAAAERLARLGLVELLGRMQFGEASVRILPKGSAMLGKPHHPNGGYYVWVLGSHSEPLEEGPAGPHELESAKTFARISATKGGHDRVVSRGRDPEASSFEIVRRYQAHSGTRII